MTATATKRNSAVKGQPLPVLFVSTEPDPDAEPTPPNRAARRTWKAGPSVNTQRHDNLVFSLYERGVKPGESEPQEAFVRRIHITAAAIQHKARATTRRRARVARRHNRKG